MLRVGSPRGSKLGRRARLPWCNASERRVRNAWNSSHGLKAAGKQLEPVAKPDNLDNDGASVIWVQIAHFPVIQFQGTALAEAIRMGLG